MRYLPATPLPDLRSFRYSLLKDDIIDFPYFFINLNFFFRFSKFLRSFALSSSRWNISMPFVTPALAS